MSHVSNPLLCLPGLHERIYDDGGVYTFVVEKNVALHAEARSAVMREVRHWGAGVSAGRRVRVLDLGCGGAPVVVAAAGEARTDWEFEYTGIDIHPDQIRSARRFPFPANFSVRIVEGDVWSATRLPLHGTYDFLFIGLHTHHAGPAELDRLFEDLEPHLAPGALFLNHDCFRPPNAIDGEWRPEFISHLADVMRVRDADELVVQAAMDHAWEHDFPIAAEDLAALLRAHGFSTTVFDYLATDHPLREYYALVRGIKNK